VVLQAEAPLSVVEVEAGEAVPSLLFLEAIPGAEAE